jgi:hypothetical protein
MIKALPYKSSDVLIIGTSFFTQISIDVARWVKQRRANTWIINENAETEVRRILELIKRRKG